MKDSDFQRVFKLPFNKASQFFRDKLTMPTGAWNELNGAAHAKAFASAGAYHADLLAELRRMTDKAIAGGMDIREFRKQFRPLVERYGWQLNGGGPSWRSDLIWRTNISTAYQAGRWQQFRDGGIDYLKYVHSDGVRHPRPTHLAMDGKIMPIDDPFWTANYPPNGWGCKCRAVAVQEKDVVDATPAQLSRPDNWQELAEDGWRYNVGQAGEAKGYEALTEKFESLPNDIAREWMRRWIKEPAFARFVEGTIGGEMPVAILAMEDVAALGSDGQAIWLASDTLAGQLATHPDIGLQEYRRLPEVIDGGQLVVMDEGPTFASELDGRSYRAVVRRDADRVRLESLEVADAT